MFQHSPATALNHVLFRCEHEEKDISAGTRGPYGLPSSGSFAYAGIVSYIHLLEKLKVSKDMGHELFDNIRNGDWYIDYAMNRIREYQKKEPSIGLQECSDIMCEYLDAVKCLPGYAKPKYASRVIEAIYN
jgi:glycogen debranching enzyme